jgi:hypothetical protein
MNQTKHRQQLEDKITFIVEQTALFPDEIVSQTAALSTEELEKLTITLYVAQQNATHLNTQDKARLEAHLATYYQAKKRVYVKAESAWRAHHEAQSEAQESLFENALLEQL